MPAVLAAAGLLAVLSPPEVRPFSAYEEGPQGGTESSSRLAELGFHVRNLHTDLRALEELPPARPALFVVPGLAAPLSQSDMAVLEQFVEDGGRVLVADDSGFADALSQPYGVANGRFAISDLHFAQNASILPTRFNLGGPDAWIHAVNPVLLVVGPDAQGQVVGTTQDSAFLDLDGDGALGLQDQVGPFPVAFETTRNARGGGYLFVSAAGLLQNQRGAAASAAELDPIFQYLLEPGGTIVFDERGKEPDALPAAASRLQGLAGAAANPWFLALATVALAVLAWRALRRCLPAVPLAHRFTPDADATPPGALRVLLDSPDARPETPP